MKVDGSSAVEAESETFLDSSLTSLVLLLGTIITASDVKTDFLENEFYFITNCLQ